MIPVNPDSKFAYDRWHERMNASAEDNDHFHGTGRLSAESKITSEAIFWNSVADVESLPYGSLAPFLIFGYGRQFFDFRHYDRAEKSR